MTQHREHVDTDYIPGIIRTWLITGGQRTYTVANPVKMSTITIELAETDTYRATTFELNFLRYWGIHEDDIETITL